MGTKPVLEQRYFDLYDRYAHGFISRREFIDSLTRWTASGAAAMTVFKLLSPDYALASQVEEDDPDIRVSFQEYPSPEGAGKMQAYVAEPRAAGGKLPGVVVIHENRGLNPYVADVARRIAKAGFIGFAPDALTPFGGYPGNDDDGRILMQQRNRDEMLQDFVAAVRFLQSEERCTGTVGCIGFCYGGGVSNALAVQIPDLGAAVPFYGSQPDSADVAKIHAPLMIHYAALDTRVNEGWPDYEAALDAAGTEYTMYLYEGTNHGFHNDTTPRYDPDAARLAWDRSMEFFHRKLV